MATELYNALNGDRQKKGHQARLNDITKNDQEPQNDHSLQFTVYNVLPTGDRQKTKGAIKTDPAT